MGQQDRGPDHVALPGRLFGGQRLGGARVGAERLDEVERPALRERLGLGCQIREHGVDRGVDILIGHLGGLAQFGDGRGFFGHGPANCSVVVVESMRPTCTARASRSPSVSVSPSTGQQGSPPVHGPTVCRGLEAPQQLR